jgi:triphosphoribosyl-dephospho-CoA synthetase
LTNISIIEIESSTMAKMGNDLRINRRITVAVDDCDFGGIQASASETAEYLAQMASELVLLAKSAQLERLSVLLDLVRREAESAAV